jgi:hypothetical protein
MLNNYVEYLESLPLWDRSVASFKLVPCYRVLKGNLQSSEWFNPQVFAKQGTLFGLLVKELTLTNLQLLANASNDKPVTLLLGYAAVSRTKLFEGSSIPKNNKKIQSFNRKMTEEGFDSLSYTDENKYKNLILWDPFPLLAICRIKLSKVELDLFAKKFENIPLYDLKPVQIDYKLPEGKILFLDSTRKIADESSDDEESDDGHIDFGRYLIGTELEGLQVQLNALIDGIGFGGTIPKNMESNLTKKLQFINRDASPFAGIVLLEGISKEIKTPLLDLLLAMEYYDHDHERSRECLDRYLERMRQTGEDELHPFTLILGARFDKPNSKKLLSAFVEHFPTAGKYLSKGDRENMEESDDEESIETQKIDPLVEEWSDLKYSNPGAVNSEAMDKLLKLTGLKKVKEEAIRMWKSALILRRMDEETRQENAPTSNYCFLGNPGTGKFYLRFLLFVGVGEK